MKLDLVDKPDLAYRQLPTSNDISINGFPNSISHQIT